MKFPLLSDHIIIPTELRTNGRRRLYFVTGPIVNEYAAVTFEQPFANEEPLLAKIHLEQARNIAARVNDGVSGVERVEALRYKVKSESGMFEYVVTLRDGSAVDVETARCTCEHAKDGRLCWHIASVQVFVARERAERAVIFLPAELAELARAS